MRLEWLFGIVSKKVSRREEKPEKDEEAVEGKLKLSERWEQAGDMFKILRIKGMLSQLKRLLKEILRHVNIRELNADFKVGLDDPADTGLLFAFVGPATVLSGYLSPHQIRVQPSFDSAGFEGYLYAALRLRPIQVVSSFLRFAFSTAAMKAMKMLISSKWRKKK